MQEPGVSRLVSVKVNDEATSRSERQSELEPEQPVETSRPSPEDERQDSRRRRRAAHGHGRGRLRAGVQTAGGRLRQGLDRSSARRPDLHRRTYRQCRARPRAILRRHALRNPHVLGCVATLGHGPIGARIIHAAGGVRAAAVAIDGRDLRTLVVVPQRERARRYDREAAAAHDVDVVGACRLPGFVEEPHGSFGSARGSSLVRDVRIGSPRRLTKRSPSPGPF